MKTINYIAFYDSAVSNNERIATLSGVNKMDYISDVIIKSGFKVSIISPSWATDKIINNENLKGKLIILGKNKNLLLFKSIKIKIPIFKPFKIIYSLAQLFFWIIQNIKSGETVVVYHAPLLAFPILAAKFFKKFAIILEVEEIYTEVWQKNLFLKKWEWKLLNSAKSYICASDLLAKRLGEEKCVVVYGSYNLPKYTIADHKLPGINLIYAGSIDEIKGGVYNAIKCLKYLNEKYTLHICGYGSQGEIEDIVKLIAKANIELNRMGCIFHGKLLGKEFSDLLHSCDIGLNPQNEGLYMNSAFPSKILTYLSHNLHIISTNIEGLKISSISDKINFSKNDSPIEIAKTILQIDCNKFNNNKDLILTLEKDLIVNFSKLL